VDEEQAGSPVSQTNRVDRHVGSRLRRRRVMMGLTQKQLGDLLGVTYQQVHKYESGRNRISAGRLYDFSVALDVAISWFFECMPHPVQQEDKSASNRAILEFMRNVIFIEYDEHLQALSKMTRALSS